MADVTPLRNYGIVADGSITPEIDAMLVSKHQLPNGNWLIKVKRALVPTFLETVGASQLLRRTAPDAVNAILTKGKLFGSARARMILEAERLITGWTDEMTGQVHDGSLVDLKAIATAEGLDASGLTDRRDCVVAILQHRYGDEHGGISKETLVQLQARVQAATLSQIKAWAAARQIDIVDCTTKLQAAQEIARALGYIA